MLWYDKYEWSNIFLTKGYAKFTLSYYLKFLPFSTCINKIFDHYVKTLTPKGHSLKAKFTWDQYNILHPSYSLQNLNSVLKTLWQSKPTLQYYQLYSNCYQGIMPLSPFTKKQIFSNLWCLSYRAEKHTTKFPYFVELDQENSIS